MTAFRSILVPLDGSAFAEQALPFARAISRAAKAKLRLVLVHQLPEAPATPEVAKLYTKIEVATRRAERDYLNRLVDRLKREDGYPQVSRVILDGPPGPTLATYAAEWDASLVVMSTHGRGPLQRAWIGSVADHLVRHLAMPILLIRPDERMSQSAAADLAGRILVPLDGSSFGEAALAPAGDIARLFGAELHLIQVLRPVAAMTGIPVAFPAGYDQRFTDLCRRDAQDYLNDIAERLREQGLHATATAVLGEATAATILDLAHGSDVRLVALSTHGRGGLRRVALGSVADKVIRSADHPVLVCPTKTRRR